MLDASAAVELLLATRRGRVVADRIESPDVVLAAPELLDVEVAHVVRRAVATDAVEEERGALAIEMLGALDVHRYPHTPLLPRIWQLRHGFSAYDAAYLALTEALDATLLTCDRRLARAPTLPCKVDPVS